MAAAGEIRKLAIFLQIPQQALALSGSPALPVLQMKDGTKIQGIVSIAKHLTKNISRNSRLLGSSPEEMALVNQWLEYRVTHVNQANSDKDLLHVVKELNDYLSDKVYFVGHQLTLPDILLYYALHRTFEQLTFYEKQQLLNVSRWFDQVQSCEKVRQDICYVPFQRNIIYSKTTSH